MPHWPFSRRRYAGRSRCCRRSRRRGRRCRGSSRYWISGSNVGDGGGGRAAVDHAPAAGAARRRRREVRVRRAVKVAERRARRRRWGTRCARAPEMKPDLTSIGASAPQHVGPLPSSMSMRAIAFGSVAEPASTTDEPVAGLQAVNAGERRVDSTDDAVFAGRSIAR